MTVKELIEELGKYPEEEPVVLEADEDTVRILGYAMWKTDIQVTEEIIFQSRQNPKPLRAVVIK